MTVLAGAQTVSTVPNSPYNWRDGKIKQWDTNSPKSDFNVTTGSNNAGYTYGSWHGGAQLAPFSQDWTAGYDATASDGRYRSDGNGGYKAVNVDTTQKMWQNLLNRANANFCNQEYYVPLFVNVIQIDLGISGSYAQARETRDFYPHNITMPSFSIQGQCYSTAHYGSLAEYIHMAQHQALNNTDLIQFYLAPSSDFNNDTGVQNNKAFGVKYVNAQGRVVANEYLQKIVGQHGMIICQGYINSFARTHEAGNHRPTWTADFVVSHMLSSPIFSEATVQEKETGTWLKLLSGTKSQNWLDKQNETNNVKTLKSVTSGTNTALSALSGGV